MPDKLQLALNHALSERQAILSRQALAYGGINYSTDTKRPRAWQAFGFPNSLAFQDFKNLYDRQGVAFGTVNKLVAKCWEDSPWIIQGDEPDNAKAENAWERSFRQMAKRLHLWRHVREADKRRLVGRYSALILQVADDQDWRAPLEPGAGELVGILPAWEGQLEPTQWDEDTLSVSYGMPLMWSYQEQNVDYNRDAGPGRAVQIHHSRVVVIGDIREGKSFLEAPYNGFVTLEKILGGAGETFLKNAARQVSVNFDKDVNLGEIARAYGVDLSELQVIYDQMARDLNMGHDSALITQGANVNTLVDAMPDPEKPWRVALQEISAATGLPAKIVVGNQTGERASSEDNEEFNALGQSRRLSDLDYDVRRVVDHLMEYRLVDPLPEYTVMWSDLTEAGVSDKLANAELMAKVNQAMLGRGEVYTVDEIREVTGHEALDEGALGEALEDDEDE